MNNKLIRILERYELDKPILMQDKLDIIWDKNEKTTEKKKKSGGKKIETLEDAKAHYEELLKKTTDNSNGNLQETIDQYGNIIHSSSRQA